jgi:hypothetical protein
LLRSIIDLKRIVGQKSVACLKNVDGLKNVRDSHAGLKIFACLKSIAGLTSLMPQEQLPASRALAASTAPTTLRKKWLDDLHGPT